MYALSIGAMPVVEFGGSAVAIVTFVLGAAGFMFRSTVMKPIDNKLDAIRAENKSDHDVMATKVDGVASDAKEAKEGVDVLRAQFIAHLGAHLQADVAPPRPRVVPDQERLAP